MEYFIIKNRLDGSWLPDVGRGATHAEPTRAKPPRLFNERQHAYSALKWWLSGRHTATSHGPDMDGDYDIVEHTEPAPERLKADWYVDQVIVSTLSGNSI